MSLWHKIHGNLMIYAPLSQNIVLKIYALFPQMLWDWKADSANFSTFRMYGLTVSKSIKVIVKLQAFSPNRWHRIMFLSLIHAQQNPYLYKGFVQNLIKWPVNMVKDYQSSGLPWETQYPPCCQKERHWGWCWGSSPRCWRRPSPPPRSCPPLPPWRCMLAHMRPRAENALSNREGKKRK